mmetsp:Transcript_108603/g.315867  ORF Transcript_108603/g.315867 Transcript_108603/m.315867 type:complete len:217 (-) Transcript_108603:1385-2035(-)
MPDSRDRANLPQRILAAAAAACRRALLPCDLLQRRLGKKVFGRVLSELLSPLGVEPLGRVPLPRAPILVQPRTHFLFWPVDVAPRDNDVGPRRVEIIAPPKAASGSRLPLSVQILLQRLVPEEGLALLGSDAGPYHAPTDRNQHVREAHETQQNRADLRVKSAPPNAQRARHHHRVRGDSDGHDRSPHCRPDDQAVVLLLAHDRGVVGQDRQYARK